MKMEFHNIIMSLGGLEVTASTDEMVLETRLKLNVDACIKFNRFQTITPQEKMLSQALPHVAQCKYTLCEDQACRMLTEGTRHVTLCWEESSSLCGLCMDMIVIYYCHVQTCTDAECKVTFCSKLKKHLKKISTSIFRPTIYATER